MNKSKKFGDDESPNKSSKLLKKSSMRLGIYKDSSPANATNTQDKINDSKKLADSRKKSILGIDGIEKKPMEM